jgi:hypothetical protein
MDIRSTMKDLDKKKEFILARELAFANAVGAAVFEKPRVSFWMVLVPLLFLYFIHRMQKYKSGRMKFDEDFMVTRRRALELAIETLESDHWIDLNQAVHQYGLPDELEKPYAAWMNVQVDHYRDLLAVEGDNYDALVRKAYHTRTNYLLTLNRLNTVEKDFYAAIKPKLTAAEGTADIIATIEKESQRLRRDLAEQVFV